MVALSAGIDNGRRGTVEIANSILARNRTIISDDWDEEFEEGLDHREQVEVAQSMTTNNQTPISQNSDCRGTLISQGYNLVQDSRGCTLAGDAPGDLVDVDALLGTLEDNGGLTPTHALLEGSPAIDSGNPALPESSESACQATDQRGTTRPQGTQCDIGAFELADDTSAFPQLDVLDVFDRANGPLGANWSGSEGLGGYQIIDEEANVVGGGPIYWQKERFGPAQEVYTTLKQSTVQGQEQDLLLKVQGEPPDWREGTLEILYDANAEQTYVESFTPENGWIRHAIFDVSFTDGDQLGGRALTDGTVEVFRNGDLVGTTSTDSFFADKGGYIGLWFIDSAETVLDDFGGGTLSEEDN
ncbi:MAG: choice-of-anchor Q domain-containing protein [Chloroflexota bacterium]